MPPKKSNSKRKVENILSKSPLVKDPFSASKRSKKEVENDNDVVEIENEKLKDELKNEAKIKEKSPSPEPVKQKKVKKTKLKENNEDKDDEKEEDPEEQEAVSKSQETQKYDKEEFKSPSNGKEYNLKIVSWNINGIRAWLDKGGLDYLKSEDPDIFCCQETKCDKSKIPPKAGLPNYYCYWLSGDTQGYSGVGLMSKIKPLKVTYGINHKKHDNEGRVIVAEYEKFILINTYIPNSGRGLVRLNYRMEWEEEFRKYLASLEEQKPIIWTGDLNVAHNPIDLKNPDTNLKTAGFTVEERACFTKILKDGYFDSFRHLYPNVTGAYTFWSYLRNARQTNAGWRLDYFVLSEKLKPSLVDNMIRSKILGSDHCPIALFLKI